MILTIDDLRARASSSAVSFLCLLVLAVLVTGQVLGTGGRVEALALGLITLAVWLETRRDPSGLGARLAAAAGLAFGVAFIVWLMRGHPWQPDAHMMFFAAFALTAVFCDWRPILLYAGIIAVHHLVLNYALTAAIYPGAPSFGRVVLHAAVLIVQALSMVWLAAVLVRLFHLTDENARTARDARAQAEGARQEAEAAAAREAADKREIVTFVEALGQAFGRLTRGDLTTSIDGQVSPRYQTLRHQFDEMAGVIRGMVEQLERSAGGLRDSAEDLARVAQQNAAQSAEQSGMLGSALDRLRNMTEGATGASDHALSTSERMVRSRAAAEEGGRILESAVAAMGRMEASSGQIGNISKVMEGIAFQTNLLALNAGVEAARAGDAGRGFAVVATEVRALAQRAAESAKDIQALVSTSRQNMAEGSDLVQRTSEALGVLIRDTVENAAAVAEVAARTRAQSADLAALVDGLRDVEEIARKGAVLAETSLEMSTSLRRDSQVLTASAASFRRGGAAPPTRTANPLRAVGA